MAIKILPTLLVNKIAAGEVVERPASIVKELVENSIDAGAGRIDIAVEDGGKRLISVTDDGAGMSAEDLALAFAPNATSKIAGEDDLFAIATMGFRGEALASAASVSHCHIRTRRRGEQSGWEISAGGGDIGEVRPCAAAEGTTVTVRDLFFNTPARRKFLRTANTEFGHVAEQLARLSLPQARIAFRLTHNGRRTHNLPQAQATAGRVAALFGTELAEVLLPISHRGGKVGVAGLIAPPVAARASARWQYFFLNGRYVRDRLLAHALREAYRGLMDRSRWPVAFVFLRLDPTEVDINVHPTKIEVRFRDGQLVHGELLRALSETLNKADLKVDASVDTATATVPGEAQQKRQESLREALADFFRSAPPAQRPLSFPRAAWGPAARPPRKAADVPPTDAKVPDSRIGIQGETLVPAKAIQLHDSYIVTGSADGVVIIDQHALHERILYNDLKRRLTARGEAGLIGQRMLIPPTVNVTAAEAAAIQTHGALLRQLGIELVQFGPGAAAVQQFPAILAERGVAPGEFVREILDKLTEDAPAEPEHMIEHLLQTMACKAAVKAGDPLSPGEIEELLAKRDEAEKASSCPHGRPTTLKLTLRELEKQFKRK